MELTGISNLCGQLNLAGLRKVEYVPTTWVDVAGYNDIVVPGHTRLEAVPLDSGKAWLTMPLLPLGKLWNESSDRNAQGKSYEQQVSGATPLLTHAASGELEQMDEYRYLLRLTDRNGLMWVLGTLNTPFDFSHAQTTQDENGLAAYSVRWVSVTQRKAPGFSPG